MFMDTIMINANDEYKFQMISKFKKGKLSRKETEKHRSVLREYPKMRGKYKPLIKILQRPAQFK